MTAVPADLSNLLRKHGQEHVLAFWDRLSAVEQAELVGQLCSIRYDELAVLYSRREEAYAVPALERLQSLPRPQESAADHARYRALAEAALRQGQVAYLLVAGGQGSRLGFEKPKGMYPIGPVTDRTLFHVFAESLRALRRRYQAPLPFLVMTSPATDAETRRFFAEEDYFGLPENEVWFFQQRTMPALDLATGKLLLEAPGRLFLSPNGHGGTLTGMAGSGLLKRLREWGVNSIYYFQVDNPLVGLSDLDFIGRHLAERAEVSNKVITKHHAQEKLGNYVLIDGRLGIIEYSDLTDDLARLKDESGGLFFWAGNPAIHLFDLAFLERLMKEEASFPWHVAQKKVPFVDASGEVVQPSGVNALKFERFIFDVLPRAERWTVASITREEEFEPLKNATGADSPETVRAALTEKAARRLEEAGVQVPRMLNGKVHVAIEISAALTDAELRTKAIDWNRPVVLRQAHDHLRP